MTVCAKCQGQKPAEAFTAWLGAKSCLEGVYKQQPKVMNDDGGT